MKHKSTKRALVLSGLALLICVSMLLGTTFAWFTDSVTSAGNIVKSGTLDVEMYWTDGTQAVPADGDAAWKDASAGAIFNYDLWEPGYVDVKHIEIKNNGTLALKYKLSIVANGNVSDLADVIDVYFVDPAVQVTNRAALAAVTPLGSLTEVLAGMGTTYGTNHLLAGQSVFVTLALKMRESAGNEYQNKSIGTDFSVQLIATQYTYEEDSFDDQYDVDASYPIVSNGSASMSSVITSDLTINATGEIESANIPAAAANALFDDMADTTADSNELTLTLNVSKLDETVSGYSTSVALDIDMTAVMVSTTGGVSVTDTQNVTNLSDYVTIQYNLGAGLSAVTAAHKGHAMVNSADTADDAGYGIYSYDSTTGILTIKTNSLSPFTVNYYETEVDYVSSAEDLVSAMEAGNIVVLNSDITIPANITAPYGNKTAVVQHGGILDGNGHRITVTNGSGNYGILTYGGTIRNLTITGPQRGIVSYTPDENVILEKVTIENCGYAFNTAEQKAAKLIATDCVFMCWTSFAGLSDAEFRNCEFKLGYYWQGYGYDADFDRLIRPYDTTVFIGCTFEKHFYVDLSALKSGSTVTFQDCTSDGVELTAENYRSYITIEDYNPTSVFFE